MKTRIARIIRAVTAIGKASAVSSLLLMVFLLLGARATLANPVVYTFTGTPLSIFNGLACPPHCAISGSVVLSAPLGPSVTGLVVTPLSFSFSDGSGGLTIDSTDAGVSSSFQFSTDATGAIDQWIIFVDLGSDEIFTDGPPASLGKVTIGSDTAGNGYPQGVWSFQGPIGQTPEPSSLLLLGAGLLALGLIVRRGLAS